MMGVRSQPVRLVAGNEIRQGLRNKAMRVSFVIMLILTAVGSALPGLLRSDGPDKYRVAYVGAAPANVRNKLISVTFLTVGNHDEGERLVRKGKIDALVNNNLVLSKDALAANLRGLLEQLHAADVIAQRSKTAGLSTDETRTLLAPVTPLVTKLVDADRNDGKAQGLASAVLVVLFFALTAFGSAVLSGVLQEKASRVVEVVLGSIRAEELLMGKILGIGALAMAQVAVIAAVAGVVGKTVSGRELPSTTLPTLGLMIVAFMLGYLFYATLFAAAGSLVSRVEDAQAAASPVTILLTMAYVLSIAVAASSPDGLAARIFGVVPFTAPMVMIVRSAAGHPRWWELLAAVVLMIVSVALVVRFAARVYRGSVLRSGTRVKWSQAWRNTTDSPA